MNCLWLQILLISLARSTQSHTHKHTCKQSAFTHTHSAVLLLLLLFPGLFVYIIDLFSIFANLHFVAPDLYIYFLYNPRIANFHCPFTLLFAIYELFFDDWNGSFSLFSTAPALFSLRSPPSLHTALYP